MLLLSFWVLNRTSYLTPRELQREDTDRRETKTLPLPTASAQSSSVSVAYRLSPEQLREGPKRSALARHPLSNSPRPNLPEYEVRLDAAFLFELARLA